MGAEILTKEKYRKMYNLEQKEVTDCVLWQKI